MLDISKKNLGCVVSGKLTLCCSAEERARLHALKRATAVDVVRALAEVELAYPGESMYVIFIAAHEPAAIYELGDRWCPLSSKAERAIAEVWASRAHGGRPTLVEIAIPRAEWLDENTPHPLSVSRQFSLRSLPVIVQWCHGRAGKRLTYPSNSDQAALADYFGISVELEVPTAMPPPAILRHSSKSFLGGMLQLPRKAISQGFDSAVGVAHNAADVVGQAAHAAADTAGQAAQSVGNTAQLSALLARPRARRRRQDQNGNGSDAEPSCSERTASSERYLVDGPGRRDDGAASAACAPASDASQQ